MKIFVIITLLIVALAVLAYDPKAGIPVIEADNTDQTAAEIDTSISVPVVLHIARESGNFSSARSNDELLELFAKTQGIWDQADIKFDMRFNETVIDDKMQEELDSGNWRSLYQQLPEGSSALHVFFLSYIGGSNGLALSPSVALVADRTSVNDWRTTAHEIGHLLGLQHTPINTNRLLDRGANGENLTDAEIRVARQNASRLEEASSK